MAEDGEKRDAKSHRTRKQMHRMDHGYNHRPENIKKRANNNEARAKLGLKKGDPRDADHIKPQRAGGSNDKSNLRAVHQSRNRGWADGKV